MLRQSHSLVNNIKINLHLKILRAAAEQYCLNILIHSEPASAHVCQMIKFLWQHHTIGELSIQKSFDL